MKLLMNGRYRKVDHERLRAAAKGIDFVIARSDEQMRREAADADILMGVGSIEGLFPLCKKLKWVQIGGAGVEWLLFPALVESDVVVTNARGIFSNAIADHVLALVLAFYRDVGRAIVSKERGGFAPMDARELWGETMGIIGPGSIGSEVARRARAFGMTVLAVRRRPHLPAEAVDEVYGREGLGDVLRRSDVLTITAPLTSETRGLVGEKELSLMKPTAILVNVGRGEIVDEDALIRALERSRLGGAGLDVFSGGLPPPESRFWQLKNVILTPHMAGDSQHIFERRTGLYCENIRRFIAGTPLVNVVDKRAGY